MGFIFRFCFSYCVHFFLSCVCVHLFFIFTFLLFLPICTIHVMYIYSVGVSNRCQVWTSALRTLQTGQVMAHISFSISFVFLLFIFSTRNVCPEISLVPTIKILLGLSKNDGNQTAIACLVRFKSEIMARNRFWVAEVLAASWTRSTDSNLWDWNLVCGWEGGGVRKIFAKTSPEVVNINMMKFLKEGPWRAVKEKKIQTNGWEN